MRRWWTTKLRQAWSHARARVTPAERYELTGWLSAPQLELFDRMHTADQRHGLDVVATLRDEGVADADLLVAGLLHDAGKGPGARLPHRVAWSLGEVYGAWVWRSAGWLPTFGPALERLRVHAERSAELAARAGCTPRTVELIRCQDVPADEAGRLLHAADEAN